MITLDNLKAQLQTTFPLAKTYLDERATLISKRALTVTDEKQIQDFTSQMQALVSHRKNLFLAALKQRSMQDLAKGNSQGEDTTIFTYITTLPLDQIRELSTTLFEKLSLKELLMTIKIYQSLILGLLQPTGNAQFDISTLGTNYSSALTRMIDIVNILNDVALKKVRNNGHLLENQSTN